MASFSPHLPEEVLEIIFSWLPADSLIRFKCVSKSWRFHIRALINDREFVAKHLGNLNSRKSSASLVLSTSGLQQRRMLLLTSLNYDCDNDAIRPVVEDLDFPRRRDGRCRWTGSGSGCWDVAFHCDGIICLVSDHGAKVMLCNPALHEYRLLPETKNSRNYSLMAKGFGYDARSNDYKFVRLFHHPERNAEVYTLGTDSWRRVKMSREFLDCDIDMEEYQYDYLYWKGVCYWPMEDFKCDIQILSFSMSFNIFRIIEIPDSIMEWSFAVWNDSVALFSCVRDRENADPMLSIEIWVMSDYRAGLRRIGGTWTWTKHLVIGPLLGVDRPIMTFGDTDELLMMDAENKFLFYNLNTRKLRNVDLVGSRHSPVCYYVKSLVSVKLDSESLRRRAQARRRR